MPWTVLSTDDLAPEYIAEFVILKPPIVASKATRSSTAILVAVIDFATILLPRI